MLSYGVGQRQSPLGPQVGVNCGHDGSIVLPLLHVTVKGVQSRISLLVVRCSKFSAKLCYGLAEPYLHTGQICGIIKQDLIADIPCGHITVIPGVDYLQPIGLESKKPGPLAHSLHVDRQYFKRERR